MQTLNPAQLGNLVVAGQRGDGPPRRRRGPGASDPTGGVKLFDAVEKQLRFSSLIISRRSRRTIEAPLVWYLSIV
jgi:hypothetical protein